MTVRLYKHADFPIHFEIYWHRCLDRISHASPHVNSVLYLFTCQVNHWLCCFSYAKKWNLDVWKAFDVLIEDLVCMPKHVTDYS